MKVAVIGMGHVGATLGRALEGAGHQVRFGSRSHAGGQLSGIDVVDVAQALEGAEAVLVAIPGAAVAEFAATHGGSLQGALVVDATNNLGGSGPANGHEALSRVPGLRYARAFNTLGWENFEDPRFGEERADLFFSCDDASDVDAVAQLIEGVGLRPIHVGTGQHAAVDGLLALWFALSKQRGRHLAFRLLSDEPPG